MSILDEPTISEIPADLTCRHPMCDGRPAFKMPLHFARHTWTRHQGYLADGTRLPTPGTKKYKPKEVKAKATKAGKPSASPVVRRQVEPETRVGKYRLAIRRLQQIVKQQETLSKEQSELLEEVLNEYVALSTANDELQAKFARLDKQLEHLIDLR